MKRSFFLAAVVYILLYGCITWMLTKRQEKKLDGNYTRMLRAILNKSWRQHPTKHQLYGRLPPITKTIQVRRTRHAGHCWRSRDKLISDVLLWTPTYGQVKAGRLARTYIQQLCEDTGCSPEDLPETMNDMMMMMISITHWPNSLPTNTHNKPLYDKLKNLTKSSKRSNYATNSHAGIYSIPWKDCDKHHIGETQRNQEKRIYEHKRSIKLNDDRNTLFSHMLDLKHTFNFFPGHCNISVWFIHFST